MILLCVLVAVFPWWAVLLLLFIPIFLFQTFYWGIIVGFFMDIIYGHSPRFGFPFIFLATTVLLTLLLPLLKRRLVFWKPPIA